MSSSIEVGCRIVCPWRPGVAFLCTCTKDGLGSVASKNSRASSSFQKLDCVMSGRRFFGSDAWAVQLPFIFCLQMCVCAARAIKREHQTGRRSMHTAAKQQQREATPQKKLKRQSTFKRFFHTCFGVPLSLPRSEEEEDPLSIPLSIQKCVSPTQSKTSSCEET